VGLATLALGAVGLGAFAATGLGAGPGDLKLGGMWPLTGTLAPYGGPAQKAANLAVEQLNGAAKTAGVDLNVSIVNGDSQTDPKGAQALATKLVDSDGVKCISGPMASSEVISAAQNVTIDAGVPVISPSSTASSVRTDIKQANVVFRVPPPDNLQAQVLVSQMTKAFGKGTINIAGQNDAYGTGLVKAFTSRWKQAGGKIGTTTIFNITSTSYDSEAAKITRGNPKGYAIFTFPVTWKSLGAALVRTGKWSPAKTFGTDGLKDTTLPKSAGRKSTEGMRGTVPSTPQPGALEGQFTRLWNQNNLGLRQTYDSQSFDGTVLCALAAVRAGSTDPAKIAAQVRAVSGPPGQKFTFLQLPDALKAVAAGQDIDYQGAAGPIDLGAKDDPAIGGYVVWQYKNGKLVTGKKTFVVGGKKQ
jgi:branched-chain amino acid transport system substrate-binding protein